MKKTIVIFLFSLTFLSISQAQIAEEYGVKIGGTMSNQNWDYDSFDFQTEFLFGVNIGIFAEVLNYSNYCLVFEANFVQKGMREDEDGAFWQGASDGLYPNYLSWETRINYINISALFKYKLKYNNFNPYFLLGPKIDYEINKSFSGNRTPSVENEFSKYRVGIKIGLGSNLKFLSENLFLELLYDRDFNPLYDNEFLNIYSYSIDFRIGLYL